MKVGILAYQNCSMWNLIGVMEIFLRANSVKEYYYGKKACSDNFEIEIVGADKTIIKTRYDYPISYHSTIFDNKKYDLLMIPGFDSPAEKVLEKNSLVFDWIREQYLMGAKVASFCTGNFLLAKSGILGNKPVTTHWVLADKFIELFPNTNFCREKIIIDNGDIFIGGGATSFQNLMVYLIEKFMGRTVALGVSKLYLIDFHKDTQGSYAVFNGLKKHNDSKILKAQKFIEENCKEKILLPEISQHVSMSMRTFIRRFKGATGETPLQYIQKVKIGFAKRVLETEMKSFEEIVYEVGYEDVNAFRKLFIKHTGISPSEYKRKYSLNTQSYKGILV